MRDEGLLSCSFADSSAAARRGPCPRILAFFDAPANLRTGEPAAAARVEPTQKGPRRRAAKPAAPSLRPLAGSSTPTVSFDCGNNERRSGFAAGPPRKGGKLMFEPSLGPASPISAPPAPPSSCSRSPSFGCSPPRRALGGSVPTGFDPSTRRRKDNPGGQSSVQAQKTKPSRLAGSPPGAGRSSSCLKTPRSPKTRARPTRQSG